MLRFQTTAVVMMALLLPAAALADLSGTFTMDAGTYTNFDNGNGVGFSPIGDIGFDGTNLTFLGKAQGAVFPLTFTGAAVYYGLSLDTLESLASQESPNPIPISMMPVDSILGITTNRGNATKILVTAISPSSLTFRYQTYIVDRPTQPLNFVPVTPCRVADTRNADGPFGGPAIPGDGFRDFTIPNSACGIPSSAAAYSLNVAVVPRGSLGYLTVWPAGQVQPLVATLNSVDGRIKSNAGIVPAGANGAISVFSTNTTDVILDINGYFAPASDSGLLAFYTLTPCRIADTRNPAGPLAGPRLEAQATRSFPISESSCSVPRNATAYSLNLAAGPSGPLGYLTAWPTGEPQPLVASLSSVTGTITANAVIVPAGTNGDINVFATNATDLVIDIDGYFAPPGPGGLSLYALAPCRVLDTRQSSGSPFSGVLNVHVGGTCAVPATAQAYVINATVVPPGPLGYITLWPQGESQPAVATLNAVDGVITSNMAIVPTANDSIDVFASSATQLVLDISAYFAPNASTTPAANLQTSAMSSSPNRQLRLHDRKIR